MIFAKKDTSCAACCVSPKELIKVALIDSQEALERLMLFAEKHYFDEVTVGDITIKRTVHLLPEDPDAEKKRKQAAIDLISYGAD